MNIRAKEILKNLTYTFSSNFISLLISSLVVLVVPKLIGVEEYGYWQLYLLYSSYVGFMHFGWNDGIFLRYGGRDYSSLNKKVFASQFWMLAIIQFIIALIGILMINEFVLDNNKKFILLLTLVCMILLNLRRMLLYILQSTNKIKEYSRITIIDRLIYIVLLIFILIFGYRNFQLMIIVDLIGKALSLLLAMNFCKDIIFSKLADIGTSIHEMYENISVGIKLMIANITSILVIGVVRLGIERAWDISTFAKVSLTLSISNLIMVFINAIGIVMYPILRRTNAEKLPSLYGYLRDFLMIVLLFLITLNYPIKLILSLWLPDYASSLEYLVIIFPMVVFEGKMMLLISTYLKTYRKEELILRANIITLFISIALTFLSTVLLHDLNIAVLSILLIFAARSIISEIFISKLLNKSMTKDIILELILVFVFVISAWTLSNIQSFITYMLVYVTYLILKKNDIKRMIAWFKLFLVNQEE